MGLQGKTAFITGASRGIGKAIALRLAEEGVNIAIAAKSVEEDPRLGGTIYSAAKEIEQVGVRALPLQCDIRFEDQVQAAVSAAAEAFGGIDILVNNASAIELSGVAQIEPRRYDLMQDINVRGTFFVSRACIPFLKQAPNPHILTLSPPINFNPKWFSKHLAYTLSKYSMSMVSMGLAAEFKKDGIASYSLWPKTTIATAAVQNLLGGENLIKRSRTPEIMAEAAFILLSRPAADVTGQFYIDEDVLRTAGFIDFEKYAVTPGGPLYPDLFVD